MRLALSLAALLVSFAPHSATAQDAVGAPMWRAEARNNICGVSNPRHVTNPAVVDYKALLNATPEMRDLENRDIDPRSAEGQILRQRAVDHVRREASKVMRRSGNCSVWKEINHRGSRQARELTREIVGSLNMSTVAMNQPGFGSGEVYAADGGDVIAESYKPAWVIPAFIGLILAAGWYAARRRSVASGD